MSKKVYFISIIIFLIDQMSKSIISTYLKLNESINVIQDFFYIRYINNYGASWGILENNRLILICVSVLALLVINKYIRNELNFNKLETISYGLLIGGIFGNLFDRIFRGYVIDFLNFNIFGYNFPVFNIADSLIVIGVLLMAIDVIRGYYGSNSKKK